ncbi:MAG: prolipoprotein diacylglyceryl transferase [Actinomycetota bacterium]|nr:prolipoprotein diacylglyceryl transferase [Actinomycetota bacterium]
MRNQISIGGAVTLAEAFKFGIDPLAWEIIPRIELGPLSISPHGLGIALGYLAGAQLMVRRARTRGGPDEADIWNTLFWALIGAIVGARVGYLLGHFSEVTDGGDNLLGVFEIWEGGISLIGGITGAVLFALPYLVKKKMGFWRTVDLAVPGLALGIVIGRVGDLMIGDHLGKATDFALGWRCLGEVGGAPPAPVQAYGAQVTEGSAPSLGCFATTLHQTALYDLLSTAILLGVLLWLGKRVRNTGMLTITFVLWYGVMRMITDTLRVDRRYFGLTGSQIMSLTVVLICAYLLLCFRGAPPRWAGAPQNATAERDEDARPPPTEDQPSHAPQSEIQPPQAGGGTIGGIRGNGEERDRNDG